MKTVLHNPTTVTASEWQTAYDFFNMKLFKGILPFCLITMQREKKSKGYFCAERFKSHDEAVTDEIAMNPKLFWSRTTEEVLSTLVHEMAHLWQFRFGAPGRRTYHNAEWGKKMKEIGLHPSDTGKVGGKETGERMTHYIMEAGPFQLAATELIKGDGFKISWGDRAPDGVKGKKKNKTNREKFTCPDCEQSAWGKPGLNLMCGECEVHMEQE